MTIDRDQAHWRVERVTPENYLHGQKPLNIPVAWFVRRWQAEEYVHQFANDSLNTKFSYLVVDETPVIDPPNEETMTTYYITTPRPGAKLTVHSRRPDIPHYVVNAASEVAAIELTKAYRTGYQWAVESALAGDIRIDTL